ncbi:MAG: T9SS type A sorting domain-containing protein, partial [Chitinophagaceae bacterium]|nr:T9SS type A sorting domain-containing protein [Chitinophagaceae bacterium]
STTDTVTITSDPTCGVLESDILDFKGKIINKSTAQLSWKITDNNQTEYFEVERSINGRTFQSVRKIFTAQIDDSSANYFMSDDISNLNSANIFYRLKVVAKNLDIKYSKVVQLSISLNKPMELKVYPNPATNYFALSISSSRDDQGKILISSISGALIYTSAIKLRKGSNVFEINNITDWPDGTYFITAISETEVTRQKVIIARNNHRTGNLK